MGMKSRRKGRKFEQDIAKFFRGLFPGAEVRRSWQAFTAWNSDVVVEGPGVPEKVKQLWLECNDALEPDPIKKLEQAERDVLKAKCGLRIPVVIWHKTGTRGIKVTTRLRWLTYLSGITHPGQAVTGGNAVITLTMEDFAQIIS